MRLNENLFIGNKNSYQYVLITLNINHLETFLLPEMYY